MYLYRIDNRGTHIEIGIYDPERWDGKGGMAWGLTADVYVNENHYRTDAPTTVEVSQGTTGSCSTAVARQRADVYRQAIEMADFISDQLADGMTLEQISNFLIENLGPGVPHENGFRYNAKESPLEAGGRWSRTGRGETQVY